MRCRLYHRDILAYVQVTRSIYIIDFLFRFDSIYLLWIIVRANFSFLKTLGPITRKYRCVNIHNVQNPYTGGGLSHLVKEIN